MVIDKIKLTNFRCFDSFELNLHPSLTVLVAENGGGKTAVLDGAAIGLTVFLRYFSTAQQRLSGRGIKDTDIRINKSLFEIGDQHCRVELISGSLKWEVAKSAASTVDSMKPAIGQTAVKEFAAKIAESLEQNPRGLFPVFAYYGADRGSVDIPERLRGVSKINYEVPISALAKSLDPQNDFREMLMWFDAEEANELRINKGRRPNEFEKLPSLVAVRKAIESVLGGGFQNPHFNAQRKFVVTAGDGTELRISQLSQGYQSMLALAMDYARRLATGNGHLANPNEAPGVMLIDEIDIHLHPRWQQRVISDLQKTFPNTQLILTTHSPQVISTVPRQCIRIIKDGNVFGSTPGTDGSEANRMLQQVFGVDARPDTENSRKLAKYMTLVDEGKWNVSEALKLRQALDTWSQGYEPLLTEADIQIEHLKWEESDSEKN